MNYTGLAGMAGALAAGASCRPLPSVAFIYQRLDEGGVASVGNRGAVRQILEDSGMVELVLQGHERRGGYQKIGSIHYYTAVAFVEGGDPADNTRSIVQLHPDGSMEITGFSRSVSVRMRPAAIRNILNPI